MGTAAVRVADADAACADDAALAAEADDAATADADDATSEDAEALDETALAAEADWLDELALDPVQRDTANPTITTSAITAMPSTMKRGLNPCPCEAARCGEALDRARRLEEARPFEAALLRSPLEYCPWRLPEALREG